jgi:hypothetical protein
VTTQACPNTPSAPGAEPNDDLVIDCRIDNLHYGEFLALRDVEIPIRSSAKINCPFNYTLGG